MWRAFFIAVGTMLVIVGVESLLIDSATLASEQPEPVQQTYSAWIQPAQQAVATQKKVVRPPDWFPWSFIASGSVVILYAMTLPRRWGEKKGD